MAEIRNAELRDAQALARIEEQCFSDPILQPQLERMTAAEDQLVLCAQEQGAIAGYVSMQTVLDEGYINNVAVLSEFRRRGIARALLSRLEELAADRELAFMTLEVREGNAGAIALYELCGFEKVGLRKNYYQNPKENAIIMTKFLK